MPRSSSGSRRSPSGVDPERSAKRIVTTLRCSCNASRGMSVTWSDALSLDTGVGCVMVVSSVTPHEEQNRSRARRFAPQFAQRRRVPTATTSLYGPRQAIL